MQITGGKTFVHDIPVVETEPDRPRAIQITGRTSHLVPNEGTPPKRNKSRMEIMQERATALDAEAANHPRFLPRLNDLLDDKPSEWIKYGETDLKPIRRISDDHAEMAKRISMMDVPTWLDRCREESCKKPGLFKSKEKSPDFFKAMLERFQPCLQDEYSKGNELIELIKPRSETLRLCVVALSVVSQDATGNDKVVADGRLRTLINGQTTALMLVQSLEGTLAMLIKQTQEIDNLLNAVIPAWTIAYSKA